MVKRHFWVILILAITLSAVIPVGAANAQTFKSCKKVNLLYPNGVALDKKTAGVSKAQVNRKIYLANRRLDSNKNGIVCERDSTPTPKPVNPRWMRAYPPVRTNTALSETGSPIRFLVLQSPTISERAADYVSYFARRVMSSFEGVFSSEAPVLILIHDGTRSFQSNVAGNWGKPISEQSRKWLLSEMENFGCSTESVGLMLSFAAGWVSSCGLNGDGTPKQVMVMEFYCATTLGNLADLISRNIMAPCLAHELGHVTHNLITLPGTKRPDWFNESFATYFSIRFTDSYPEWAGEIRYSSLSFTRREMNKWMRVRGADPQLLSQGEISQFLVEFLTSPPSRVDPIGALTIETLIAEFGDASLYSWIRQWSPSEDWQKSFERVFQTSFDSWINNSLAPTLAVDLLGDCGARYSYSNKKSTCPTD